MMHTTIPATSAIVNPAIVTDALANIPELQDDDTVLGANPEASRAPKVKEESFSALVNRASLAAAVAAVNRAVDKRNFVPILGNVLIKACDGGVTVTGTDLDIEMTAIVSGAADHDFATTVPGHKIGDLLKKAKASEMVAIDVERVTTNTYKNKPLGQGEWETVISESVLLDFDGLKVSIQGISPTDYPKIATGTFTHSFAMPAADMARAFNDTAFAISTEETRYYLNGVYMEAPEHTANVLRFVATDGHRLAHCDMPRPDGAAGIGGVIVPRKTILELLRLCGGKGAPDSVSVEVSGAKIRVAVGGVTILSKLIDGTFPDYGRVIPVGNDKELNIDRKALIAAIEQVSCISSERGRAVKFMLRQDSVVASVHNPDFGNANTSVPADFNSDPMDIGFNGRYVLDILNQISSKSVRVMLADPGSPTLFLNPEDRTTSFTLMPMRV